MNPLILIGLGAVALMAMGGKKKSKTTEQTSGEGEPPTGGPKISPLAAMKAQPIKPPPSDYVAKINSKGQDFAQQCMNQGHKEEMDLTMCIAKKLFPDWDWNNRKGWMTDAWPRVRNVARIKIGKDPIIT